jgi:hypothetical protein
LPIRVFLFLPWADAMVDAAQFVEGLPAIDLPARVANPGDADLMRMARLDCDWHGETARAMAAMRHRARTFLPMRVVGVAGLSSFLAAAAKRPPGEAWWLVLTGRDPRLMGGTGGRLAGALRACGVRILWYGFDDVSRSVDNFGAIAPHLDWLIHDESPLAEAGRRVLAASCRTLHRSWVANVVPWEAQPVQAPEPKIVVLGSQMGLSPHRRRQMEFLKARFKDRFVAIYDHSVPVSDRAALARHQVSWCPEGRKFAGPTMSRTHTDRPFWSGCLGMVPVSEDSAFGGRLDELAEAGLILRYPHGDLNALAETCERALGVSSEERRRIYEHFNANETIGGVIATALAAA